MSNSKSAFRQQLLDHRQALHDRQRLPLDRRICVYLLRYLDDLDALNIAAFHPFRGEPDLLPAMVVLQQAARRIYLPVLSDPAIEFRRWQPGADLAKNRFGILEPHQGQVCPVESLDVVFMPLVGFSATGTRLGMGGGYYDRAFADFIDRPGSGPQRVGVAYGFQQLDSLPIEPWDVPLDAVITERGCQVFRD